MHKKKSEHDEFVLAVCKLSVFHFRTSFPASVIQINYLGEFNKLVIINCRPFQYKTVFESPYAITALKCVIGATINYLV